jgi:hypothetical protein
MDGIQKCGILDFAWSEVRPRSKNVSNMGRVAPPSRLCLGGDLIEVKKDRLAVKRKHRKRQVPSSLSLSFVCSEP